MFTQENTENYTDSELAALNDEWLEIAKNESLEPETDEYNERQKQFADEVARR